MRRGNEGIALIWSMLMVLVIALFVGMSIDTGYYVWAGQELQLTADASALGGAAVVKRDAIGAHWKALEVGRANNVAWDSVMLNINFPNNLNGDVSHGRYDRTTRTYDTTAEEPNAVRVIARRTAGSLNGPLPTLFGDIFGISTINIGRDAIAMSKGGIGPGILLLDSSAPCALDIRGTAGQLTVEGGAIYVDSDSFEAACHSGRPTVDAPEMYVVGEEPGTDGRWDDQVNYEGDMFVGEPVVPDPLEHLPEPYYDPLIISPNDPVHVTNGDVLTIGPGYYPDGITEHGGDLTLLPGVYILDGPGLDVNGGIFIAHDVLLFIVDTTMGDNVESHVNVRGNGVFDVTGFSDFSENNVFGYEGVDVVPENLEFVDGGVPIWQDDDNTNDSRILGTSDFSIEGTIYMPENHLEIGGESDNFAWGLIANTLQAHGNGILNIDYHGQFPPLPLHVYLVE